MLLCVFKKTESINAIKAVIDRLPQPNLSVLTWIFTFIKKVAQYSHKNKMGIPNLVIVFAPCIFKCPSAPDAGDIVTEGYLTESIQITKIMGNLLDHFDEVFDNEVKTRKSLAQSLYNVGLNSR